MAYVDTVLDRLSSQEGDLDRQIEVLIGKIVDGTATDEDKRLYQELASQRAKRMRPSISADLKKMSRGLRRRW